MNLPAAYLVPAGWPQIIEKLKQHGVRFETLQHATTVDAQRYVLSVPKWADARYSLGSVYARIDRVPDAVRELRAALDLEPRHFRANLLLGRILTLQGDPQRALQYLQTAVDVQPSNAEARQFLADAVSRVKK